MIVGVDLDSFKATLCAVPFDGGVPVLAEARWRSDSRGGDALSHLGIRVESDAEVRRGNLPLAVAQEIGIGERSKRRTAFRYGWR